MMGYKEIDIDLELHKKIIENWELDKDDIKNPDRFMYSRFDDHQDLVLLKKDHLLFNLIKLPIEPVFLFYVRNPPRSGLGPVHIDGNNGRTCVLNIPIKINLDESFFFVIKEGETATERPPNPGEIVNKGGRRYLYEPEKYDYHNLKKSCILNSKIPHGFANFANEERVILSICFDKPFDVISSAVTHI
jgi:hypothetical protein